MEKKLDKISDDISEIKTHLAVYNEQLKHHIKRSDQADAAVQLLDQRIQPIEKHVLLINYIVKIAAITGSIILFCLTILEFVRR